VSEDEQFREKKGEGGGKKGKIGYGPMAFIIKWKWGGEKTRLATPPGGEKKNFWTGTQTN